MLPIKNLTLESLEPRLCLAGNIVASVENLVGYEGQTAVFRGDQLANSVQIIQTSRNDYTALGVGFGDFDTTINGVNEIHLNDIQNFLFDMGDGDDFLFINGDPSHQAPGEITIDGQVKFFGRGGSDNVLVEDTKIRGKFFANLGTGNNFLQWIDSRLIGSVTVESHSGNDFVGAFRSVFHDDVSVSLGSGNDSFWSGSKEVELGGSRFMGAMNVKSGSGADHLRLDDTTIKGDITIKTGNGKDFVTANDSRIRSGEHLRIWTGKHSDRVELSNVIIQNEMTVVRLGDGQDSFHATRVRDLGDDQDGMFILGGGKHLDIINFDESIFDRQTSIRGNHGNDEIRVKNSKVTSSENQEKSDGRLSIDGGSGVDFTELINLVVSAQTEVSLPGINTEEVFLENIRVDLPDVHNRIADLLEQLRTLQDLQVTVEVRFITLNDSFFERVGIDFDFDPKAEFGAVVLKKLPGQSGEFSGSFEIDLEQGMTYRIRKFETDEPRFGGFDPSAGMKLGFAILSDLDTYFLIRAAQPAKKQGVTLRVQPVVQVDNQFVQLNVAPQPFFATTTFGLENDK